jgi:exodeoxyribonuclease-3
LLTYNIRRGGGGREDALLAVIRPCGPDIVILQEATDPAVVRTLAQGAAMPYCAAMPKLSLGFMSRIFGVHLSAVFAALTERRRSFELRALIAAIKREQHGFHLVAGDFNTVAPGELLDLAALPHKVRATMWLSGGRIRWRTIQLMLDAGYTDAFRALHPGDPGLTLPTTGPQVRLDYLFVPSAGLPRVTHCEVVRTPATRDASDHFPLLAELTL